MTNPISDPYYEAIDKIAKGAATLRGDVQQRRACDGATVTAHQVWQETESRKQQQCVSQFFAYAPSAPTPQFKPYP